MSTLSAMRGLHIKTTVRFYITTTRKSILEKTDSYIYWQEYGWMNWNPCTLLGWQCQVVQWLKSSLIDHQKVEHRVVM